jgi:hypothetical protein
MSAACEQTVEIQTVEEVKIPTDVIEQLEKFEPENLKHTDVQEKIVLPSKEDIETEKKHLDLVTGLETFDKNKLKPTKTEEKIVLPDRESKLLVHFFM